MQKKLFLYIVITALVAFQMQAIAQTEKGKLFVGLSTNHLDIWHPKERLSFNVNASVGYFVLDNLVLGTRLGFGYGQQTAFSQPYDYRAHGLSAGVFGRYYVPLTKRLKIPIEVEVGTTRGVFRSDYMNNTYWSGHASISTGLSLFLNQHVSVDGLLGYEFVTARDAEGAMRVGGHFKGSLGLSMYLGGKKPTKFE